MPKESDMVRDLESEGLNFEGFGLRTHLSWDLDGVGDTCLLTLVLLGGFIHVFIHSAFKHENFFKTYLGVNSIDSQSIGEKDA